MYHLVHLRHDWVAKFVIIIIFVSQKKEPLCLSWLMMKHNP